jgi:hypothetical protein
MKGRALESHVHAAFQRNVNVSCAAFHSLCASLLLQTSGRQPWCPRTEHESSLLCERAGQWKKGNSLLASPLSHPFVQGYRQSWGRRRHAAQRRCGPAAGQRLRMAGNTVNTRPDGHGSLLTFHVEEDLRVLNGRRRHHARSKHTRARKHASQRHLFLFVRKSKRRLSIRSFTFLFSFLLLRWRQPCSAGRTAPLCRQGRRCGHGMLR